MIILRIPIPLWPALLWLLCGLIVLKVNESNGSDWDMSDAEDIGKLLLVLLAGPILIIVGICESDLADNIKTSLSDLLDNIRSWFVYHTIGKIERKKEEKRRFEESKREHSKPGMFEW